jgi:hypothetical protein
VTKTSTSFLDSRFSFAQDGDALLPGIYEATPAEITAQMIGVDRASIRRRSKDMQAPGFRLDGNDVTKILMQAIATEQRTYRDREKGAHRGDLGALSIELLKVLIWFGRKYGRIFPSLEKLAYTLRKCEDTIFAALERLISQKFVTKHRRSKEITTAIGRRRVQDSNAYEIHLPDSIGQPLPLPTMASDPKNSVVSSQQQPDSGNVDPSRAFWLLDPYQRRDRSWA